MQKKFSKFAFEVAKNNRKQCQFPSNYAGSNRTPIYKLSHSLETNTHLNISFIVFPPAGMQSIHNLTYT